jgi:F-type H+-transporting ATPase subunit gamma
MATGKEIRGKIKNFESTKKITKAMEMISVSKMRKAQERMRAARPYAEKVRNIAANLGEANPEYVHPFMKHNDTKVAGMIVVTTDKGLCGGLNTNVLRSVTHKLRDFQTAGATVQTVAIGNKGFGFLNRIGAKVVAHVTQLGDKPHLERLIGPVKVLLDAYARGEVNAVYLSYTRFINTMRQEVVMEKLLPLSADAMAAQAQASQSASGTKHGWDYIYEPDADWLHGGAPAIIQETLVKGRMGNMPPMAAAVGTPDDVKNVAQYVLSLSGSPHDSLQAALGKSKFAACAACHGMDGKGNPALGAPNLTDDIWLHGYGEAAIVAMVNNGKVNQMPAQADKLTEAQIHVLASYVWGLSNNGKKAAP